jgi:2-dehydro-3-deoxy-D-arabinonate dehydratase
MRDLVIALEIQRQGKTIFHQETSTRMMKRSLEELVDYLFKELDFPHGVLLMTGTGIVPPDDYTLQDGDLIRVQVGVLEIKNPVSA